MELAGQTANIFISVAWQLFPFVAIGIAVIRLANNPY